LRHAGIALAATVWAMLIGQATPPQPTIAARAKRFIAVDGLRFKDLNGDGSLEPYEDWRLSADDRVRDLVGRMTLAEKAGVMLIDTLNAECEGALPAAAAAYVETQQMNHFIFRNAVTSSAECTSQGGRNGQPVTPRQAAAFTNAVQELSERTRLGIPALFKSNARNHLDPDPRTGINETSGAFSAFPKEPGIAAAALGTGNMSPVEDLARVAGSEWRSIGLRGMYGYIADLSTEPRWFRIHETFSEDADLNARIISALVQHLQGGPLNPRSPVALTVKHFPGGGPQEAGLDPHYTFGKTQVYPGGYFGYHLKPFAAAIAAGVSAVMPYYGVPIGLTHDGVRYDEIGMAFSKQIVTDLLRSRLGFKGYVNSDTGVIDSRAWGLEARSVPERVATAINVGTDMLSGFHSNKTLTDLVASRLVSEERISEAAARILKEQFQLGLFENPYVDVDQAADTVGRQDFRDRALEVQRQSIVLLQNLSRGQGKTLPLKQGANLYVAGALQKATVERYGYRVTDGNHAPDQPRPSAAACDYALIAITALVSQAVTSGYRSNDTATGANASFVSPVTGGIYGANDPAGLDNGLIFGGTLPWEANALSFSAMASSRSWQLRPSLADIQAAMHEVGPNNTVLAIYFRQPFVLDDASGLKSASAILAHFSVSDTALMDVLSGRFKPQGKLPFALPNTVQAIIDNQPDVPGYPARNTLYPFGFGLSY
jgi:beta-glucosidase